VIYAVSGGDWPATLASFVRRAKPGDEIRVSNAAQAELAKRAMKRLNVQGVAIVVQPEEAHGRP